jgi:hypothetical protein
MRYIPAYGQKTHTYIPSLLTYIYLCVVVDYKLFRGSEKGSEKVPNPPNFKALGFGKSA